MSYSPTYTRIGFPRPTPAIGRLMVLNLVVFVANAIAADALGRWLALSWDAALAGYGLGALRLLSYQFVHSFDDPFHLLFNLIALYFFGGLAERSVLGYRGVVKVYLLGGAAGGLLHMAMYGAIWGHSVPVVGASGSCFALVLYAVCTQPRLECWCLFFNFQLIFIGFLLVGLALYDTYVEILRGRSLAVSHGAHLGGAALGFVAWRYRWFHDYANEPGPGWLARLQGWRRDRRHQGEQAAAAREQQELDRILQKIQEQGLPSLSTGERRTLDRISQRKKRG